jgi:lipoprotein-releasing system ATP-binding protein
MLQLLNVEKKYQSPSGEATTVLQDVSLDVIAGTSIAIVGPSGSGKSTLLNIIGGLDSPTAGSVLLEGKDLARAGEKELAKIRSRDIGFVFQLHHLLPQLTVLENVLLPTLALKTDTDAEERARALLNRVALGDHLQHVPAQLSGGERQRAAVVRALINNPKLLLADEPTGSLDQDSSKNLADLLAELNTEVKVTLIVVTHSTELADKMQMVYELSNWRLSKVDAA